MLLTIEQFNTYSGNMENSPDVRDMKETLLISAEEVVQDYLGFDIESQEHDDFISAIGQNKLFLHAYPITEVTSVCLSGSDLSADEYSVHSRYLRRASGVWPTGIDNVEVVYTAGWTSTTIPEVIKATILQIASLMLEEAGGNIGITGKTMSENSRTFINYTNYDKWLKKLDPYRIVRFV